MKNHAYKWLMGKFPFDDATCGSCLTQHRHFGVNGWCDDPGHLDMAYVVKSLALGKQMDDAISLDQEEGHPLTIDGVSRMKHLNACIISAYRDLSEIRLKYKHLFPYNPKELQ